MRDVLDGSVDGIALCHSRNVAHTAAYETLEHEEIAVLLKGLGLFCEVKTVYPVALLQSQIPWSTIYRLLHLKSLERFLCRDTVAVAPFHHAAYAVENGEHSVFR